jgi:hypothetical protein
MTEKLAKNESTKKNLCIDQLMTKQAFIDGSSAQVEYSGNANEGFRIKLGEGDFFTLQPEHILKIFIDMAKYNPLLDDSSNPEESTPSRRFERWVEKESPGLFGRQLANREASLIRGVFGAEGILGFNFSNDGIYHVEDFLHANPLKALEECKGRICIYREKALFLRAKLVRVKCEDDCVDITFDVIDTPGFNSGRRQIEKFNVGSTFDYLSLHRGYVSASMVSWTIVTDIKMVEHLTEFATTLPNTREFMDELYRTLQEDA